MQKPTFKHKKHLSKQAFTLIELLIVIAIIGILFIVLVSKVDFATDKAKATGVQTDFRSFQLAFDTVAKENAGFNTFGWDEGDTNGDHVRNSYDEGDTSKDGVMDPGEVWTGRKVYTETWTGVYTLVKPGTSVLDSDAIFALESAINKNLDPKLHITISTDGTITMANGAQDPWKTEYHGVYITNAENDKKDRGALIMYSNGANQEFGSEHSIANGIVTITVPGNNKLGADDYSIVSVYTYANGYGEVKNATTGFSNNQTMLGGNSVGGNNNVPIVPGDPDTPDNPETPEDPYENIEAGLYKTGSNYTELIYSWDELLANRFINPFNGIADASAIVGDVKLPNTMTTIPDFAFNECSGLTGVIIPESVTSIGKNAFYKCTSLTSVTLPSSITILNEWVFGWCTSLESINTANIVSFGNYSLYQSAIKSIDISDDLSFVGNSVCGYTQLSFVDFSKTKLTTFGEGVFYGCKNLDTVVLPQSITSIPNDFCARSSLTNINFPSSLKTIGNYAFEHCKLSSIDLNDGLELIGVAAFNNNNLTEVDLPDTITSLGINVFDDSIKNIVLPKQLLTIQTNSMHAEVVTMYNNVKNIEANAFQTYTRKIIFIGTMNEWLNIEKADSWYSSMSMFVNGTIECLDGTLKPDGTIVE